MKKILITTLLAFVATMLPIHHATAQNRYIDITSFRLLQTDMDARIQAPVFDQNGKKCALIKVSSNIKGLIFESPATGIVKQEVVNGEIWVYIPEHSRSATVLHDDFPPFRNYQYPTVIESAMVYEMVVVGHRENEGTVSDNAQMVTINVQPSIASLYIDNEEVPTEEGIFTAMMPKGSHTYRVECPRYESKSGTLDLDKSQVTRTIKLNEKFGFLKVTTYPESGADVYLNGKMVGTSPYQSEGLDPMAYTVKVEKNLYFPLDTTVVVSTGGETNDVELKMISTIKPKEGRKTFILADAAIGSGKHPSYGVMVGMSATGGGYIHVRSDFKFRNASMKCDDTGNLTSGGTGTPVYSGKTAKSRFSVTAGYIHRFMKNNPFKYGGKGGLYAFLGAGYGSRVLLWETAPNGISETTNWVKNGDHSATGVAVEAGGIFRMKNFALSLGYQTIMFKYHEGTIGFGFFF